MIVFLVQRFRPILAFTILFGILFTYVMIRSKIEKDKYEFPKHLHKYRARHKIKKGTGPIDAEQLKFKLEQSNLRPNITNLNKYKTSVKNSPIFLIQVHKDINRLQYLIMSLSQVTGIASSMLIFSHSFYSDSINQLILSIDFCQVVQIFYPHSLQLNPSKFPGVDPDDCPLKEKRRNPNCQVRNAELTEHKQHWWWKANFVFEHMAWLHLYKAPIIFLEEHSYVAPSLLLIYQYAVKAFSYYPHTEVLSFGRPLTRNVEMDLLTIEPWRPPFDVGLAFNKTTWRKMVSFSAQYCMYDDSSWSYSLLNLFRMFPKSHVSMIGCVTPRVLSTRHFNNIEESFKRYTKMFATLDVYPKKVKTVFLFGTDGIVENLYKEPPSGNGGWSDLRDQVLCLDPLVSTTTVEPRYYDN